MKICLVNALFRPFAGGIEKHMYELSRGLADLGVDVTVVTGRINDLPEGEDMDGIRVRRVPCWAIKAPFFYPPPLVLSPGFPFHLKKIDDHENFDLFHLHNRFFIDFNLALLYARLKRKPFVMTAHNPRPKHVASPLGALGTSYDWLIGRWTFVLADRVIAVSDWAKQDIAKYGVDKEKIETIHNGVNVGEFKPLGGENKHDGHGPMLLFVGRMVRQKGIPYLIEAMPLVLKRHPDARLLLIGRGSALESLKKKARAMGLDGSVVFSGYMEEDELKEAYGACDVFALPSTVEPFGIVIVEAMASGKPVVCTDSGGVKEIVADGVNGFIVPPGDPGALAARICQLLSDEGLRGRMGKAGRGIAEAKFDWKAIAVKTKRLYEEVLAGHGRRYP
jgi:glycosyltransferase involved in cell wall biosynthesis